MTSRAALIALRDAVADGAMADIEIEAAVELLLDPECSAGAVGPSQHLGQASAVRNGRWYSVPRYTTSIDATEALRAKLLPGWFIHVEPRFYIDGEKVLIHAFAIRPLWAKWTPHDDWFDRYEAPPHSDECRARLLAILGALVERGEG